MKDKARRGILNTVLILLAFAFVARLGKPFVLQAYIETTIGNCKNIAVLCAYPAQGIIRQAVEKQSLAGLVRYDFPDMEISMPREFTVIKEQINKVYYKRKPREHAGNVAYLLYERPDFFVDLFPRLKKQGVDNDFEFISRTMSASPAAIEDLTDTFFVVMKTVFTPYLGEENNIKMIQFAVEDKKGFIAYSLCKEANYFDCNVINGRGDFFKVYIKDKAGALDLKKVLAIVSTLNHH